MQFRRLIKTLLLEVSEYIDRASLLSPYKLKSSKSTFIMHASILSVVLLSGLVASESYEWQAPTASDSELSLSCPVDSSACGTNFKIADLQKAVLLALCSTHSQTTATSPEMV